MAGCEAQMGWEPLEETKALFVEQNRVFLRFQKVSCVVAITVFVLSFGAQKYIGCSSDGLEWIYTQVYGSVFVML
jgi:hypothetical protein